MYIWTRCCIIRNRCYVLITPTPLVLPSLKKKVVSVSRNSGLYLNLNSTSAFSPVFILGFLVVDRSTSMPLCTIFSIPTTRALCLIDPE